MDIAKYVTTAIILASFIGGFEQLWVVYVISLVVAIVTLGAGLLLVRESDKKKEE